MAKGKPKLAASADELIDAALAIALENVTEFRLVKSGKSPGLFASAAGVGKQAIMAATTGPEPLLEEVRRIKTAVMVRPTAAGIARGLARHGAQGSEALFRLAAQLPPERMIPVARTWLGAQPEPERAGILVELVARLGTHGAELVRGVREDEERARAAEWDAVRTRHEALLSYHRSAQLRAEDDARRHAAATQSFEELLRAVAAPVAAPEVKPTPPPTPPQPAARQLPDPGPEDLDFRRAAVEEMVETWHVAVQGRTPDAQYLLECMLRNMPGVERIGEGGQPTTFDPARHESVEFFDTGAPVVVSAPGWLLQGEHAPYVVRKAVVQAP
ncbi:hypothetical protein R5W23_001458 [Gemmata sp. JC673]|uniref:Nucleotide exchange factor GrpE n=1 Tax=Gemmata algarum TaxID=2975278 RepID=A0ABU5F036_9BACT|nr:hypothetical protein [Gemmata algarum]MDY3560232.1 hypothetical protein [Gemmata algarum]